MISLQRGVTYLLQMPYPQTPTTGSQELYQQLIFLALALHSISNWNCIVIQQSLSNQSQQRIANVWTTCWWCFESTQVLHPPGINSTQLYKVIVLLIDWKWLLCTGAEWEACHFDGGHCAQRAWLAALTSWVCKCCVFASRPIQPELPTRRSECSIPGKHPLHLSVASKGA